MIDAEGVKMDNKARMVRHMEMIQGVIDRMAHDSFLVKGWSMTLLVAGVIFITRGEVRSDFIVLAFIVPVFGFWFLDAYFLWHERLFRRLYNEVRQREATDFSMDLTKYKGEPKDQRADFARSFCSCTLNLFYGMEIFFIGTAFSISFLTGD